MCSTPSQPAQQAQVTPAPAPAPAAPAPKPTQVGAGRQQENVADFGNSTGPTTRVDRSVQVPGSGGSGLNM